MVREKRMIRKKRKEMAWCMRECIVSRSGIAGHKEFCCRLSETGKEGDNIPVNFEVDVGDASVREVVVAVD